MDGRRIDLLDLSQVDVRGDSVVGGGY